MVKSIEVLDLGVSYLRRFKLTYVDLISNWNSADFKPIGTKVEIRHVQQPIKGYEIRTSFWEINICRFHYEKSTYVDLIKMKVLMPITSAPIGRNRHMSISHRRDNPFIMAVIARYIGGYDYNYDYLSIINETVIQCLSREFCIFFPINKLPCLQRRKSSPRVTFSTCSGGLRIDRKQLLHWKPRVNHLTHWAIACHYTDKKTHFSHIFESFCPCTDPLWLKWVKWFTRVFLCSSLIQQNEILWIKHVEVNDRPPRG